VRVARYYSRNDIRVEEIPVPGIGPGEILMRVEACGLCGSDLAEWYVAEKAPVVLGHEPAGVVAEVGEGVRDFEVGDRVFAHHHVPCFTCHHCVRGNYTLCETFRTTHLDPGGFAEYIRVPAPNVEKDVVRLPPDMPFDQATLVEPIATCIRGIQRVGMPVGATVAVIGAGVTGLIHMQLCKALGASSVVVSDLVASRLRMARQLGADRAIQADEDVSAALCELNDGHLADVVIVTAGGIRALEQGMALADGGGRVLVFGLSSPDTRLPVSPHQLLFREITVTGSYSSSPVEIRQALKLMQGHRIRTEELVTHQFGLAGVGEAIRLAARAEDSMKIVITPGEDG
jgi:L-iditol 2-dehydrogenase